MKAIIEKILSSGLIDRHTTKLLESWGYLPEGSVDKVREDALKSATRARLVELAEELAEEIDDDSPAKETILDASVTWPFPVDIWRGSLRPEVIDYHELDNYSAEIVATGLTVMVDKLGRFYFKIDDVKPEWFVPGYIVRPVGVVGAIADSYGIYDYRILSHNIIYSDDKPVAVEVTVVRIISNEVD